MGQAKKRGTLEQRVADAKERIDALRPKAIICNSCRHEITEMVTLPTHGMKGIEAAFAGICPQCNGSTYAIKGDPQAVEAMMRAISESEGGELLVGMQ